MVDDRGFEPLRLARHLGTVRTKARAPTTGAAQRRRNEKIDLHAGEAPRARLDGQVEASRPQDLGEDWLVVEDGPGFSARSPSVVNGATAMSPAPTRR